MNILHLPVLRPLGGYFPLVRGGRVCPGGWGGVLSTGGQAGQTCTEEWKGAQHNPWKSNSNGHSCVLGVVWNTQKDREEKKFYRKEKKCSANLDNEDEKSKDAQELKAYYNCKRLMY